MTLTTSCGTRHTGTRTTVRLDLVSALDVNADCAAKAEWPLSANAQFETPEDPSEPFDYNAVPSTFYFNFESVGSMPVRDVIEQGLDIMVDNLAQIVKAVQAETGVEEEEEEPQVQEPQLNGMNRMNGGMGMHGMNGDGLDMGMNAGYGGYAPQGGQQGWGGSSMSPLRR